MRGVSRSARALALTMIGASIAWPATAQAGPREDAAAALGAGDGLSAGRIILANYSTQPAVLADIIYDAGKIAVGAGKGGATPEEGRVGTLAVLKTNAAYLGITP